MRVLVTGSRDWTDRKTIEDALYDVLVTASGNVVVVHGACPSGADKIAAEWVDVIGRHDYGLSEERHPALWRPAGVLDRSAGFKRNAEMVALGADLCLAFIHSGSRGATHCADLAEKAGIPVRRFTTGEA